VIFFLGERDIITPVAAAQEYLTSIRAPSKDLVILDGAGHLAEFAKPKQFLKELVARIPS
jgi:pimeloyl-ACP methyl ester carboxylesterase